jgi:hypothetical protein
VARPIVLLGTRFRAALKDLSDAELVRVEEALRLMPECFGQPHLHSGLSIRRLKKNVFECRAGLGLRLLFREKGSALEFFFVGDHDAVRRLVRSL